MGCSCLTFRKGVTAQSNRGTCSGLSTRVCDAAVAPVAHYDGSGPCNYGRSLTGGRDFREAVAYCESGLPFPIL